jgi:hypothetical protein
MSETGACPRGQTSVPKSALRIYHRMVRSADLFFNGASLLELEVQRRQIVVSLLLDMHAQQFLSPWIDDISRLASARLK